MSKQGWAAGVQWDRDTDHGLQVRAGSIEWGAAPDQSVTKRFQMSQATRRFFFNVCVRPSC